jgi:hypothetical protein
MQQAKDLHRVVGDEDGQLICSCGQRFTLVWDWAVHRNQAGQTVPATNTKENP